MAVFIVAAFSINLLCFVEAILFHYTVNSDSMQQSYLWAAYTLTTGILPARGVSLFWVLSRYFGTCGVAYTHRVFCTIEGLSLG